MHCKWYSSWLGLWLKLYLKLKLHNTDIINDDFNKDIEGHESDEIVCDNDKTRNGNRNNKDEDQQGTKMRKGVHWIKCRQ